MNIEISRVADFRRMMSLGTVGLAIGAVMGLSPAASAQSLNVDLLATVPGQGNDVWGYVSPSGREYALASNDPNLTFIEITDPRNPVIIEVIPNLNSGWGDVKTYKDHAYKVTEARSGIQVYDLSDIDNGNVTLVRTIAEPDRSHNIAVDEISGFLYTLGSRFPSGSPGATTTCWDLTDPSNPVRVGNALTQNYQHNAQIVTYTSGPYDGKQILFGCSEGRGVEIYDVTDKNNPILLSTTSYPDVAYCHQGWLSEDRQYFYANDELDELNFGNTTRTLIFNVADLSNPFLVDTFTTGLPSIDHNLYWKDGFLFEANYTSGLRIIDACDPENLVEVGYYDTYPSGNGVSSNGAWGVYPFFPSGTCIVNNNNENLYILDPSAAVSGGCSDCYPDCDTSTGVGILDIFDFLCFQDLFVAGDPYACDCDTSTGAVCDIFDFLCFQDSFVAGCP